MADEQMLGPTQTDRPEIVWRSRLDGTTYGFRLAWNSRLQFWALDCRDSAGATIQAGIRVALGWVRIFGEDAPPGQVHVVDTSGENRDPDRNAWRTDFQIRYRPAADVEIVRGTADEIR